MDAGKHAADRQPGEWGAHRSVQKDGCGIGIETGAKHGDLPSGEEARVLPIRDVAEAVVPALVGAEGCHLHVIPLDEGGGPDEAVVGGEDAPFQPMPFESLPEHAEALPGVGVPGRHRARGKAWGLGGGARDDEERSGHGGRLNVQAQKNPPGLLPTGRFVCVVDMLVLRGGEWKSAK